MSYQNEENESLEEVLKNKVNPMIEKSMKKNWGVIIPKVGEDISDKLRIKKSHPFIRFDHNYKDAKVLFKKDFLFRELIKHEGNISELAKFIGLDRRSIHRSIKELGINFNKKEFKKRREERRKYQKDMDIEETNINEMLKGTIDQYKTIIQEDKIEKMYEDLPYLSKDIARTIPHEEMTWKQAEKIFEKNYLKYHLNKSKNIKQLSINIELRPETVSRKLSKLGIIKI